ncbi:AAA family ATPase [Amycolatopsis sp. H20-H5]|uniref:AAA family ATPase n=1 Tax=Amycolatopsis sp. H20-H5 TaxID=3046309 RepID=UPI002DB6F2CA|nr:AAA family ATPase [Amycolatopsis sp. H20-H5]MEC3978723.1 AAA family ATPase [Amycolatopsis sp. H20-H5]
MIKKLTLTNWRSYEDVTIPFGPGTTFVVASNGIGKSSLMEALRWALFGKIARDGHAAIRVGAASATAAVELDLPDRRTLTVERILYKKQQGATSEPMVWLDGEALTQEQLERQLGEIYQTEPTFLANLTVPEVRGQQSGAAKLDFADHLGRYYGIDALSAAVERLTVLRKQVQNGIKQIKGENSVTAKRLDDLKAATDRAAVDVSAASAEHQTVRERLDRAHERERAEAALRTWEGEQTAWVEAATNLTRSIAQAIGRDVGVEDAESVLDERLTDLDRQLEAVRVEIAVAREREAALKRNDQRLGTVHDDCPVCRRPVDESTIASAHQTNEQDVEVVRDVIRQRCDIEEDIVARRESLTEIRARWRRLRRPGNRPQSADGDGDATASAELDEMSRVALDALVDARTEQSRLETDLAQAREADDAMRRLEALFRQEATLTVALQATEATRDELLEETVRPLANEVNQRWKALFPTRGDLRTSANGDITRSISGYELPFDAFSTGESMGAAIIVRLLAAQMATGADFCWFDEPLEHLDPEVRRRVANVLSRATSGEGPLRQVVVTTYEEQLAHHLHARDVQRVHLIDVRQAS